MIRAKFQVSQIIREAGSVAKIVDGKPVRAQHGGFETEPGEVWTVKCFPVYQSGDPDAENSQFWAFTPCGELTLTTVNPLAVAQLKPGMEVYLDLTPA